MNDLVVKPDQARSVAKVDKRMQIRGKLRKALDLMIWEGMQFNDAARAANYTTAAMRKALERPHVRNHLKEARQVLRASLSGEIVHRLAAIGRQDINRQAAVSALKALEGLDDPQTSGGMARSAGVVVVIQASASTADAAGRTITVTPNGVGPASTHIGPFEDE